MKKTLKICLPSVLGLIMLLTMGSSSYAQAQDSKDQELKIARKVLETYLGKYRMGGDTLEIVMDGEAIKAKGPGYPALDMKPLKENRFYLGRFGVDVEFVKGDDGKIEKLLMIRGDGQQLEAPKID